MTFRAHSFPKCARRDTGHTTTVGGIENISRRYWHDLHWNKTMTDNSKLQTRTNSPKMCFWKTQCSLSLKWTDDDDTGRKLGWPTKMFPAGLPCGEWGQTERVAWCWSTWCDVNCLCEYCANSLDPKIVVFGKHNMYVGHIRVWALYQEIQPNLLKKSTKKHPKITKKPYPTMNVFTSLRGMSPLSPTILISR